MTVNQMRDKCKTAYSGPVWKEKVKAMPDDQIVALYFSLMHQGRIK